MSFSINSMESGKWNDNCMTDYGIDSVFFLLVLFYQCIICPHNAFIINEDTSSIITINPKPAPLFSSTAKKITSSRSNIVRSIYII